MMLRERQQPMITKKVDRPRLKYRSNDDCGSALRAVEYLACDLLLGKHVPSYHNLGILSGGPGQQPSGLQHAIGVHHDR